MKSISARAKRTGWSMCRKWPDFSKTSSSLPGIAWWALSAWAQGISGSRLPQDQRRHHRGQVEPVGGADALAQRVEHRAEGMQEGLASAAVAERGVAARHLRQVGGGLQADPPQQPAGEDPRREDSLVGDERQYQLGARQGRRPKRMHLAARPPLETTTSRSARTGYS